MALVLPSLLRSVAVNFETRDVGVGKFAQLFPACMRFHMHAACTCRHVSQTHRCTQEQSAARWDALLAGLMCRVQALLRRVLLPLPAAPPSANARSPAGRLLYSVACGWERGGGSLAACRWERVCVRAVPVSVHMSVPVVPVCAPSSPPLLLGRVDAFFYKQRRTRTSIHP